MGTQNISKQKPLKMQSGQLFQQLLTVAMERRLEIHSPLASHSHIKPIGNLFSAKFLDHTSLLSFAPPSPFPAHSQAFETSDHDISAQDQKDQNLMLLFQITEAKLNIEIAGHKLFQVSSRSLASTHCSSTSLPSCSRRNSGSTRRDKKPPSSRSWVSCALCVATFSRYLILRLLTELLSPCKTPHCWAYGKRLTHAPQPSWKED